MATKNIPDLTLAPNGITNNPGLLPVFEVYDPSVSLNLKVSMPFSTPNQTDMYLSGFLYPQQASQADGASMASWLDESLNLILGGVNGLWSITSAVSGTQLLYVYNDQVGYDGSVNVANNLNVGGKVNASSVDPDFVNYVPHTKAEIQTLVSNVLSSLQTSITAINGVISNLNTQIQTATGAALTTVQAQLTKAQAQLASYNDEVSSMTNGANDCFITDPASGPSPIRAYYVQANNTFYNMVGTVI